MAVDPEDDRRMTLVHALEKSVLEQPGHLDSMLRRTIRDYAREGASEPAPDELDEPTKVFVQALVRKAVTADVTPLVEAGLSHDQVLEVALSGALGVGQRRLEHGLRMLDALDDKTGGAR